MVVVLALVLGLIGVAVVYALMRLVKGAAVARQATKRFALIWIPLHVLGAAIAVIGRD
jgi:hypothetical protein